MIAKFMICGKLTDIGELRKNAKGGDTLCITVLANNQPIYVLLHEGAVQYTLKNVKIGETVFMDGYLSRDRKITVGIPKNVLVLFCDRIYLGDGAGIGEVS